VVFSEYSVDSTNKTDCHKIAEILLKVALNTVSIGILFSKTYMGSCKGKKKIHTTYILQNISIYSGLLIGTKSKYGKA
jgi:hypothetical protein